MNKNLAILIGRVTKKPEVKALTSGTSVAKFSLATNHTFKNKAGEKTETTQFHNCVAFGKTAEVIGQYVEKGQELMVEGRIEYRSWDDKNDGTKKYMTEIMVDNFQFGQKAKGTGSAPATQHENNGEATEAELEAAGLGKPQDDVVL